MAIPPGELFLMRKDGSRVPVYSSHALLENALGEKEIYSLDVDLSAAQTGRSQGALVRGGIQ